MKIVFFGSGGLFSARVLDAFAESTKVEAVVLPTVRGIARHLVTWRLSREMRKVIRKRRLRRLPFDADAIRALAPDLIVVASFPGIVTAEILALPKRGVLNVHPSLLPRHRGGDPIFWTYFDDDRESGVTVHWMTERVDAGDIVAQAAIQLERGLPSRELTERLGLLGGELLARATGSDARTSQDESRATHDPLQRPAIDFGRWSAERTWHFLRGTTGEAIAYVAEPHGVTPGTRTPSRLYCADGWVELRKPSLKRRLAALLLRRAGRDQGASS